MTVNWPRDRRHAVMTVAPIRANADDLCSTSPDSLAQARGSFDRALAADPDNVDALVRSAYTDILAGTYSFVADPMTASGFPLKE